MISICLNVMAERPPALGLKVCSISPPNERLLCLGVLATVLKVSFLLPSVWACLAVCMRSWLSAAVSLLFLAFGAIVTIVVASWSSDLSVWERIASLKRHELLTTYFCLEY